MDEVNAPSGFDKLMELIKKLLKDRKTYVFMFIVFVLVIAGINIYKNKIKKKKYVSNKEYVPYKEKSATIYMFKTEWCPYCKKAQPEWDAVKNSIGKEVNNIELKFMEIDCDDNPSMAEQYKVDSYPTIILEIGKQRINYDAKVDRTILRKFINTSLN
tara:strand:+ start:1558 stop:2031 length:474 start_codon:yes stop_codon:yes gene_type:complete